MKSTPLRFANFLSFNVNPTYEGICREVERALGVPSRFENGKSFDAFFRDEIAVGYICGLPYSKFADLDDPPVRLLVAPVLAEPRCEERPVYFSDVIVPYEIDACHLADLAGFPFTYNERVSYSGYHVMGWHLAETGRDWTFFGAQEKSGSHVNSIASVAAGRAAVAAIDSHSLAAARHLDPTLDERIRVIDSIGPSPHPPVVVGREVSADLQEQLRDFYLELHHNRTLQPLLADAAIDRFIEVDDRFYDTIRARVDASTIRFSSFCG